MIVYNNINNITMRNLNMTLEEESRLSFYKTLTVIDKKKNVVLVQNIEDNQIYVKKMVDIYLQPVYKQLM